MAKYKSHYSSLGFYAKGELKRFSNGEYATEDEEIIAILDGLKDAIRVDEPKAKAEESQPNETKSEAKPKTSTAKAPARKASAK